MRDIKGQTADAFSGDEFDLAAAHDWQSVSLGPRILRTETAALAALAAIQYETGNLGG